MGVRFTHVLALVVIGAAESEGHEFFLVSALALHVRVLEQMRDPLVGQYLFVLTEFRNSPHRHRVI